MKLPATWTQVMALAIAAYSTVLFATLFGGTWLAWLCALPAMFVGLQVFGVPVVVLCEMAERSKILPGKLRPLIDEMVIVGGISGAGVWLLSTWVATAVTVFFGAMYAFRLIAASLWLPGEAEEIQR